MLQIEKDFKNHVKIVIASIHEKCNNTADRQSVNAHAEFLMKMFRVQDTLYKNPTLKK